MQTLLYNITWFIILHGIYIASYYVLDFSGGFIL